MRSIVGSIEAEYRRYKAIADSALAQLADEGLSASAPNGGNSVTVIAWHIGGNLASRFTDFLGSDGEKPWRDREDEFCHRTPSREELVAHWERGWSILFGTLASLMDDQLHQVVLIRRTELRVHEALHRSLAHVSYHVGQIVYVAKLIRGADWEYLSIPPGGTRAYNEDPTAELADAHRSKLERHTDSARGGIEGPPTHDFRSGRSIAHDLVASADLVAHVESQFAFRIDTSLEEAFPLFGAWGERKWAGGDWDPQFLWPCPPSDVEGEVFTVGEGDEQSIWVNTALDLEAGRAQYVYVTAGQQAVTIDLRLTSISPTGTQVCVTYKRTALRPEANEHIIELGERDRSNGERWAAAIGEYLRRSGRSAT